MYNVTFISKETGETKSVEVDPEKYPYYDHGEPGSLLDIALAHGIKIAHSCGGNCACTTCHVIIKEGDDSLSESTDREDDLLDMAPGLTLHSRLACQAIVESGDVVVEIPEQTIHIVKGGH